MWLTIGSVETEIVQGVYEVSTILDSVVHGLFYLIVLKACSLQGCVQILKTTTKYVQWFEKISMEDF